MLALTGDEGILREATKAEDENGKAGEEEQIGLAYNAAKIDSKGKEVTEMKLQEELRGYDSGATVTKDGENFKVTFTNGNVYKLESDGTITKQNTKIEDIVITMEEARKEKKFDVKTKVKDTLGNIITIPEGFKIAEDSTDDVTGGIVIEDVDNTKTFGSQFVWIPVGKIKTANGTETITLSRYTFADGKNDKGLDGTVLEKGTPIVYEEAPIPIDGQNYSENNLYGKSIEKAGGYYIGRYEARTNSQLSAKTSDETLPQLTEKADDSVYIYVTQPQASKLSQGMYTGKSFKSDLINSYAWDTAIVYIQKMDKLRNIEGTPYSWQYGLNTANIAEKGTNNLDDKNKQDVRCNIWDMASNCFEWTTETFSSNWGHCVFRGGSCEGEYTASRNWDNATTDEYCISFRPLLIV